MVPALAAIGRLTISWAHIEAGLDFAIDVIHCCLGGAHIEPLPRTALSRKLTYIRKWLKTAPSEPTFQTSIAALMDAIEAAANTRHDIIHGFIVEHAEGTGEAT